MICELCDKETDSLNKLYWGFFKSYYEEDKWINVCKDCQKRFLQASNIYNINRTPLIEMEKDIKKKVRRIQWDCLERKKKF